MNQPEKNMVFAPGIYEHAAALIGESPARVSRDGDLLFRAQKAAWETYAHPQVVAGIDIYNVEPEPLGAGLDDPSSNGVPSIVFHPAASVEDLLDVGAPDPRRAGRMPLTLQTARRLAAECPGAAVFIPVCGPMALANGLLGLDELLCTMMEDPELVARALMHLATVQEGYIASILEAGARPMIFESGASPPLLPPALFATIEAPALGRLFSACRLAGEDSPHCIIGGDVVPVLPELLALDPGFLICPSETDQNRFVEMASTCPEVAVRINLPVGILLSKDWEETRRAAENARALARRLQHASIGTGVVPIDAGPAFLLKLRNFIQNL